VGNPVGSPRREALGAKPAGACVGLRRKPVRIRDAGWAPNEAADRFRAPVLKFGGRRPGAYRDGSESRG
jgi:hypothetical protein